MRELNLISAGRLEWVERPDPVLQAPSDAIVRPIVVGRCDGDTLPVHRRVSRALQAGLKAGVIDAAVGHICGAVPFAGPFAIGHECIAEVVDVGTGVTAIEVGDRVVVPWSVSCGECERCRAGLTSKCLTTTRDRVLAAYGFGAACGGYGGMVSDLLRVPYADHMLVELPAGLDPLRVASASDNLADAWRTVVPQLKLRPGARVLVLGGGAQSIGLYAEGLAVAHGAGVVDYVDSSPERGAIAEELGAAAHERSWGLYDIRRRSVEPHLRKPLGDPLRLHPAASAPRSATTSAPNTGVPLMYMYATDITLRLGV